MVVIDLTIRINGDQERSIQSLFDQLSWELDVLCRAELDTNGEIVEMWEKSENDRPSPSKKSPVVAIATKERDEAISHTSQQDSSDDTEHTESDDPDWMLDEGGNKANGCDENDKSSSNLEHNWNHGSSLGHAVSPNGPVQCIQCGKFFINRAFLSVHVRTHPLELPCKVCQRNFPSKLSLESHMISHSDVRAYKCETCGKTFKRSHHLRAHERRKHSRNLPHQEKARLHNCKECGKPFFMKGRMILHMKNYHPEVELSEEEPEKMLFECETCHKIYPNKYSLKTHQIAHNEVKEFVCLVCGMAFHRKSQLTRHGSRHSGIKPFHCPACGKGFLIKSRLWRHMETHGNLVTSQESADAKAKAGEPTAEIDAGKSSDSICLPFQ